jgi:uncharacterized spore protein YtfJ
MDERPVPTEPNASEPPAAGGPADVAPAEQAGGMTPDAIYSGLRRFVDGVRDALTVRTVYGDPIEAHGVTVIPVAQTYFGVGAGAGGGRAPSEAGTQQGVGGAGGAGGVVRPIGFIEITASGARWVPITRPWQRVTMGVLPPILALLAGRAVRRRLLAGPKEG